VGRGPLDGLSVTKPPPLSAYLSASSNAPKKASSGSHRVVQCILHDLDRIKRGRSRRRLQKCEKLTYYIVQQLRSRRWAGVEDEDDVSISLQLQKQQPLHDHLLETTTIWALIHMLRIEPQYMKEVMVGAGVPGVLFDIMSSHSLTGATRQYASELCFFLTTTQPLPDGLGRVGPVPLNQLPEVHHSDKLYNNVTSGVGRSSSAVTVGGNDALSLAASELSSLADDKGLAAFVPYRINQENMNKLNGLFDNLSEDGYGNIGQAPRAKSRGGGINATKKRNAELHSTVEMSESMFSSRHGFGKTDFLDELDDQSIGSSISSASQSHDGGASEGVFSIANRFSGLIESQSMRNMKPWQSQSTLDNTLAAASFVRGGDSMSVTSASLNSQKQMLSHQHEQQKKVSNKLFHMRATPEVMPMPSKSGRTARSSNKGFLDKIISQSNAHFAIDPRLREQGTPIAQQNDEYDLAEGSIDSFDGVPLHTALRSRTAYSGPASQSFDVRSVNTAPSIGNESSGLQMMNSPLEGIKPIRLASLHSSAEMLPANRLTSTVGGGLQGALFSGDKRQRSTALKSANLHGNTPSLDGLDKSRQHARGVPSLILSGGVSASRSRLSVDSATEPSDVPSFLAQLDPLSLNVSRGLHAHILDAPSSALEVNEDDVTVYSRDTDSEDDDSEEDEDIDLDTFDDDWNNAGRGSPKHRKRRGRKHAEQEPEYYNTPLGTIERKKATKKKVKLRVRAEKLIDHRFIKQLFSKKATIEDTQNLVRRMQDVLELVDSDRSGFVTWEYFARVLLGVAPQHLLRSDVMAFMEAQNQDDQALIDYREFVITGKVIVVQRQNGRAVLPINGWLERQRLYTGDATTYTWKNHVKWYTARKSAAVIWLMRRANRAFTKSDLYIKTWRELAHIGKRAEAYGYLRNLSIQADNANSERDDAKRFILGRALHARLRILRVDEAQRYLSSLASKVVEMTLLKETIEEKLRAEEVFVEKNKQVGIERIYWVRYRNIASKEKLKFYGDRSIRHTIRKEQSFKWLVDYAKLVQEQIMLRENAQEWLILAAERYLQYCQFQDQNLLGLLRIGNKAYAYLNRQIEGLDWLIARGVRGASHTSKQAAACDSLCTQGQRTLRFLNAREHSFAYCTRRRAQADVLIARQKQSILFFRTLVNKVRATEAALAEAQAALAAKGRSAVIYVNRRNAAQTRLCHIARRAHVVRRKVVNTFIELQQIGQFARVQNFNRYWTSITDNRRRVREEVARLEAFDQKVGLTRSGLSQHERWQVELEDAFNTLAANLLLPGESINDKKSPADLERLALLTKIGFVRLLKHGVLLGMKPGEVDEAWRHLDPRATGYTTFDNLWRNWFEARAVEHHRWLVEDKKKPQGFTLLLADVLSPFDRVLFIFKKRFAVQEAKVARRGAEGGGDDEDEDEDENDGEDDDDDEEDEDDESESEQNSNSLAVTGYSTQGKTPQEIEYDRIFMRLLGNDEGPMEANTHIEAFEEEVNRRQYELEEELQAEQQRKELAAEMAKAARIKELEELAVLRQSLGLDEGGHGGRHEGEGNKEEDHAVGVHGEVSKKIV